MVKVTPLMTARMVDRPEVEPIAWVNTKDQRRVFYTSLGAPEDFAIPQFRKLLLNGILWALEKLVDSERMSARDCLALYSFVAWSFETERGFLEDSGLNRGILEVLAGHFVSVLSKAWV